jgi:type IV secretion system protein VirB6
VVFQTFWTWLTARLESYISTHAAGTAAAIEPAAVAAAVVYVMVWGYLHLRGRIEEPLMEGASRVLRLIVVFGVGLRLWMYHDVVVDLFYLAPTELAARLVGARTPVETIDAIWDRGAAVAGLLWNHGSFLAGDAGFYFAGAAVYLLIGYVCIYTLFLISLSRIALAVLLALGPIFIVLILFESTRRYFDAWLQELANYALVSIMTVLVDALLLDLVRAYAEQTAARGEALVTVDALNLTLAAGLVLLVLRQVPPICARLAGGFALSTFGSVEALAQRARLLLFSAAAAAGAAAAPSPQEHPPESR